MDSKKIFLLLSLICTILFSIESVLATTVKDNGLSNSISENNAFSLPIVNFTANVTNGMAPLNVLFTSNCTGNPTEFNWTFGDGIYSKHNLTAIHTYTQPGEYNLSLTVSNAAGNKTATKLGYIIVSKTSDAKIIIKPVLSDKAGTSINGENVKSIEVVEINENEFLQWISSFSLITGINK